MPHLRLPATLSKSVVSYLMTLPEPKEGYLVSGHSATAKITAKDESSQPLSPESVRKGKKLFWDHGCMSCHSIAKIGGQFAPPLDHVGKLKGRQYILQQITGAESLTVGTGGEYSERGTTMPPSNLTKPEITSVTDFLMSLQ